MSCLAKADVRRNLNVSGSSQRLNDNAHKKTSDESKKKLNDNAQIRQSNSDGRKRRGNKASMRRSDCYEMPRDDGKILDRTLSKFGMSNPNGRGFGSCWQSHW